MLCQVLRCDTDASVVIATNEEGAPSSQAGVCEGHGSAIADGALWRWEPDAARPWEGVILMGADLDARDIMITKLLGSEESLSLHPDGTAAITLMLERTRGDGSTEEVRLVLSRSLVEELGRFTGFWRPDETE